jgi:hypothetical protein
MREGRGGADAAKTGCRIDINTFSTNLTVDAAKAANATDLRGPRDGTDLDMRCRWPA